jgi:protein-L-isoaspartate(D-aspartate) O-methyltransferase
VRLYDDTPSLFFYDKDNPEHLRTISAPHMITIMLQQLLLKDDDDLLILGAKSGYITALAHKMAPQGKIIVLEANSSIARLTQRNLEKNHLEDNVEIIVKNPLEGMPSIAPWQKILVTGAISEYRIYSLLRQLDPDQGVLFAPIGEDTVQTYTQITRIDDDFYGHRQLQVKFTPLVTKLELDELQLITDIEELDSLEVKPNNESLRSELPEISIEYVNNIFDKLDKEQRELNRKYQINVKNISRAFLENIDNSIEDLKDEKRLKYWNAGIDNFSTITTLLKKSKKDFSLKLENIETSINQLKEYNQMRSKFEISAKRDLKVLEKKERLIENQISELQNLQVLIKKEIKSLSKF